MPQIINTNIASLNAQRNLDKSQGANTTALQRLSSGLRINSAKDDAAGLAISTRFTTQVKGLNVAVRNAGDGISLAQTAEGALASISENLQRIRELAVQSANATNSDTDRLALQQEVDALKAEITRTAEEADFNGRRLLDGSFKATFQVGANAGQTVDVQISELTADRLGATEQSGVSARGTTDALANGDLVINGVQIAASVASDDTSSVFNNGASAIAKAAAINDVSEETGVTAVIDENVLAGSSMASAASASYTINLNGVDISVTATNNSSELERSTTRQAVAAAINAKADQTGVRAVDSGNDNNGVILVAEDGRNITVYSTGGAAVANLDEITGITGLNSVAAATTANTYTGGFTLVAEGDVKEIVIDGGNGTGTGDIDNSGLNIGTYEKAVAVATSEVVATGSVGISATTDYLSGTAAGAVGGNTAAAANTAVNVQATVNTYAGLQDGDLVINGITIGASSALDDTASDTTAATSSASASGIATAAAINRVSDQTGVTATVNATEVVGDTSGTAAAAAVGASLAIRINNIDIGTVISQNDKDLDRASTVALINQKAGQTGVIAEDNGVSVTLVAADGRNISVAIAGTVAASIQGAFGLDADVDGIGGGVAGSPALVTTVTQNAFSTIDTLQSVGVITSLAAAETTYSTVTLTSAREISIEAGTAGSRGLTDSGFTQGDFGQGESGQFVRDIDVSTFEGAQDAIEAVDNALKDVAFQRAELGAIQNRFESTISNLQISSENLTAANSRIADADFAKETAELARTQVLQQAGISVLAQANQRPQQVLSLLG